MEQQQVIAPTRRRRRPRRRTQKSNTSDPLASVVATRSTTANPVKPNLRINKHPGFNELVPEHLLGMALPDEALKWVLNVLDPASSDVPLGVPDASVGPRVVIPLNEEWDIIPPQPLLDANVPYSLLIITTGFPNLPYLLIATNDSAVDMSSATADNWQTLTYSSFPTWSQAVTINSQSYYGCVVYTNLSGLNTGTGSSLVDFNRIRTVSRSSTTFLNGQELHMGGRVVSGQYAPSLMFTPPLIIDTPAFTAVGLSPSKDLTQTAYININVPIATPQQLQLLDPRHGARKAVEGDYCVLRPRGDTLFPSDNPGDMTGYIAFSPAGRTGAGFLPSLGNGLSAIYDDSWHWGFTYYQNIPNDISVVAKLRGCVEVCPRPGSSWAPLAHDTIRFNSLAPQLLGEALFDLSHSYPASYNDLRGLFGKAWRWLKRVTPRLLVPVATTAMNAAIPGSGDLISKALFPGVGV